MTVYPEKLSGRQEARAACGSQFWEQDVQVYLLYKLSIDLLLFADSSGNVVMHFGL